MIRAFNELQQMHMACEAQSKEMLPPPRKMPPKGSGANRLKQTAGKYFS